MESKYVEQFVDLVKDYNGFELCHAYRDDEDHFIGGKGSTFWYIIIKKGKTIESCIGIYQNSAWRDNCTKGTGAKKTVKEMPSGSTIRRIADQAYLMQEEKWVRDRKPRLIEDSHPHLHYVYGFGDKGLDVSEKYGVTITYSDTHDVPGGFRLRDIRTGDDVDFPD